MISVFIALAVYFLLGGLVFNHLLKPSEPDFSAFFEKHKYFNSDMEGVTQEIKKVENDWAHCRVEMAAFAAGPPVHVHETFDEFFTVESGTASILVNGEKKTLKPGETLLIPKGTPHKPFNETGEVVVLNDTSNQQATMPARFAYGLAILYPAMDEIGGATSPKILLQLAAQGNNFDTWLSEVPIPVQKFLRWMLGPTARLLGYGHQKSDRIER